MTASTGAIEGGPIVVTGASGLLGWHLCSYLVRWGWQVRALARDPDSMAAALPGVAVGLCDLPAVLDERVLQGARALVHCAYATLETDAERARQVNEEGTARLLDAARRARIHRFVFISSISAHPQAPSYYARSKHAVERSLDPAADLVIRPGLILAREGQGLFHRLRDSMRSTRLVPLFDAGRQPLQTIHIDDLCEAIVRALQRDLTGALSIAEPEPMSLADFLRSMAERMGTRCLFVPLPFGSTLATLRLIETLRLPFPLRAENLLGLKALRWVPVEEDLRRLDLVVRTAEQSLADLF